MKLIDPNKLSPLPFDMDDECIELCNILNILPGVTTFESCCGHCKHQYYIWFYCNSIDTLSRLGRATERNYSDGKWEVVVDSTDTSPYGVFWLRSKETFTTPEKMMESVSRLIENIKYWFKDEFDNYFLGQQHIDNSNPHWVDVKDLPSYGINVLAAYKYNDWEDGIWLYELCYWNGNKFENRTGKGKILKWIPQADIDKIIEDYE